MERKQVVVSVGMGPGQLDFIRRLKELGYCVASFGKGKNSLEAVALSDFSQEIDTRDYKAAIGWLESLPVDVVAVGSFAGGAAVTTVQQLANHFKTSTAVPEDLVVGTDKMRQQKLYGDYGLSSIRTWKVKNLSLEEIADSSEDRYILKPTVGRGSEGITFLDRDMLMDLIQGPRLSGEDVIQVVRHGAEYRCVIIIQNGGIKLLAPILRKSFRDTVFLGILRYSEKDYGRLFELVRAFIGKTGLINTIIKADIIVSDNGVDVIEMDIGVGGGSYYKRFVSRVYGRDLMDEYIKLITDQPVETFEVTHPKMRMEYVFNHSDQPVAYDLEECKAFYEERLGSCELQVNSLHPETKGGFASNADFIFTVMYENEDGSEGFIADDLANEYLFKPQDKG